MQTTKKRTRKAANAPKKPRVGSGCTQVPHPKLPGKKDDFIFEKENVIFSSSAAEALFSDPEDNRQFQAQTVKSISVPEHHPGSIRQPSGKIKLQLFPMDEVTRAGLEKDGYNPYLELTLNARKKISSVLERLNGKWGGSGVASGEPVLLPYNTSIGVTGHRWTLSDTNVNAGDVYTAIGSPAVFRLWYGWLSGSKFNSNGLTSKSTLSGKCPQPEDMQKFCNTDTASTYDEGKNVLRIGEDLKPSISTGGTDLAVDHKMPSSGSVKPLGNEMRIDDGTGKSLTLWDDNVTSISVGGLFSEASMQARFSDSDPKSNRCDTFLQQSRSHIVSDSLDAFIAAQINGSQGPNPPAQGSRSSILDADDTCHAFPIQKFSASGKNAEKSGGYSCSGTSCQDAGPMLFKLPNTTMVDEQPSLTQGFGCQESKRDLSLRPCVYDDENSLGLSGIKWTDSRGPFDLGLSSSRKILPGDGLSMSGIVSYPA